MLHQIDRKRETGCTQPASIRLRRFMQSSENTTEQPEKNIGKPLRSYYYKIPQDVYRHTSNERVKNLQQFDVRLAAIIFFASYSVPNLPRRNNLIRKEIKWV